MANKANNVAATTTNEAPKVDRAKWFDAGRIGSNIAKTAAKRDDVTAETVTNFVEAVGNSLMHGNVNLLNKAVSELSGSVVATNGKKIALSAIARQVLRSMNETLLPSNKIAGGAKADIFTFSKDGIAVKSDRMRGRNFFVVGDSEADAINHLRDLWDMAFVTLATKERDEKAKVSIDAIPASLERLLKAAKAEYLDNDLFAIEALKEIEATLTEITKRAKALKSAK